jgi:hypothetical protein
MVMVSLRLLPPQCEKPEPRNVVTFANAVKPVNSVHSWQVVMISTYLLSAHSYRNPAVAMIRPSSTKYNRQATGKRDRHESQVAYTGSSKSPYLVLFSG